ESLMAVPIATTTILTTVATTTFLISANVDFPGETSSMSPTSIAPSVISTSMVLLTSILTTTEADSPVPPLPPETLTTTVTRARNNTQSSLTDHLTLLVNPPAAPLPHKTSGLPTLPTTSDDNPLT